MLNQIKQQIREVPDFPKVGISYKDISPLLKSPYFRDAIQMMGQLVETPQYWAGIESRGFIFASALANEFGGGLILCRKPNKLPPPVIGIDYDLEYGNDRLEVNPGSGKVILVDDVLATGGTLLAAEKLLFTAGYQVVDKLVLINLQFLNQLQDVKSLIQYV